VALSYLAHVFQVLTAKSIALVAYRDLKIKDAALVDFRHAKRHRTHHFFEWMIEKGAVSIPLDFSQLRENEWPPIVQYDNEAIK
jgi:hypothetical protein